MSRLMNPSLMHLLESSVQALRRASHRPAARAQALPGKAAAVAAAERQRRFWQDGVSCAVLLALAFAVWQSLPPDAAAGDLLSLRLCLAASALFGLRMVLQGRA